MAIPVLAEHITFVFNGVQGFSRISPLLLVVISTQVWVAGLRRVRFVFLISVDARFLRVFNFCSPGSGTVEFGFDGCLIMGTVETSFISTTVTLGSMASTWKSQKSQPRMKEFASFSTTRNLTIFVLVPI